MAGCADDKEAGAQVEQREVDFRTLDDVIFTRFDGDTEDLIMILQAIQKEYNYLPMPGLSYVSTRLGLPLSRIYEIATFYAKFSLEPRGRNLISVCLGTACHVRGGQRVKERLEGHLEIVAGTTTEDMRFTLETVRCVGCCSLGPVVIINEKTFPRMDSFKITKKVDEYH